MFRYSAEMIEFLRANKGSMTMRELTQKFNDTFGQEKSLGAIHRVCFDNGICPKACYDTNELIAFIKKNILKMSYRTLTNAINKKFKLNKTVKQIRAFCVYHKIYNGKGKKKSEHFVFTSEMISFIKEHAQYMNRSKLTCLFNEHFDKNISLSILTNKCHKIGLTHIYPDAKEINSERKTRDGYFIKTKDGWIPKQRFLWAQKNGPIPANCCVIFADGDNTNFDEDNLILVNRKEHFRLNKNKFRFNNPDYTKAGLNIVKLSLEVEKREKEVES